MKRCWILFLSTALLSGCTLLPPAFARDALDVVQARVISLSKKVTPSVVHIEAVVRVNDRRNIVTGSGVMIDPKGTVLTNEHVVSKSEKVSVVVSGRSGRYVSEVVGTDKQTDLAVLRIHARAGEEPFAAARLGDSDRLEVGEWVVAIGNPYGLDGTVSLGIVSAKGRNLRGENLINDFIQTDAMIDRGSSGGPLVDLSGRVVGINSRGQGRGIGFTIPIDTARRIAGDLMGGGHIARGYLGVSVQPLGRELAEHWGLGKVHGVVVTSVVDGSPAAAAGVQVGDIVTEFDGSEVKAEKDEDLGAFQRMVALEAVGATVELDLIREGAPLRLDATLAVQPKVVPDEERTDFGVTVQEVTERIFRGHKLSDRRGVMVSFVERGSEAAEAGLAAGDVIRQIESTPIDDLGMFRSVVSHLEPGTPFLVRAKRGNDLRFLLITPRGSDVTS
ncbi:MAG: trypsin-like peptidase domain-containing protein [Myxococcota bacterium]